MRKTALAAALLLVPLTVQGGRRPAEQDTAKPAGPEVGKPAPAFRLNDHLGKGVGVGGKSKMWTVVAFYPRAATPG